MIPDLIYDIGMHNGDDTAHYLARGFRVVAVEANPALVARGAERFAEAIADGLLTILNVAIDERPGTVTFWVNEYNDEWSVLDRTIGGRDGTACHPITVEAVTFASILADHGIPYYLKSDIEQADLHVLRALSHADRPRYISVEAHRLEYLAILSALGYDAFKVIDQSRHNMPLAPVDNEHWAARARDLARPSYRQMRQVARRYGLGRALARARTLLRRERVAARDQGPAPAFSPVSSGPFGEETRGPWQTLEEVAYNWLHFKNGYRYRGTLNMAGWYDFHATTRPADPTPSR